MLHAGAAPTLLAATDELPPWNSHAVFTQWAFAPVVTALVAVAAAVYVVGMWRVRRRHPARPWPLWRAGAFMLGLIVIVIATQSGIGAYDDVLFWVHMWQHLLLIVVAPPLLLIGRPVTLALHASRNPLHTWIKRAVRSRVVSALTFPLVGVALYAATVVGTHLTSFMNLVLTHGAVHDAEHALYLVVGFLYFLPIIGNEPIRWRPGFLGKVGLLIVAMPVDTFTGVVLTQANHELFPAYAGRRAWGPSLVGDLHAGGAVMWIAGDGIMAAFVALLFATYLRQGQELTLGSWLESVRERRFAEIAPVAAPTASAVGPGRSAGGLDDDDARLEAYNAYLAGLNAGASRAGPGSVGGGTPPGPAPTRGRTVGAEGDRQ